MRLRHATRDDLIGGPNLEGRSHWLSTVCHRLLDLLDDPSSRVLVAEEAGRLRAVLGLTMERDRGAGERTARIVELTVDPRHSRRGIGSRLVRFAEGIALIEGCRRVDVDPRVEGWAGGRCWPNLGYGSPTERGVFKPLRSARPGPGI